MHISIESIRKHYRRTEVLSNITLKADSGDLIGILGQNGCGKSTLLSILAGTLRANAGSFLYTDDTSLTTNLLQHRSMCSKLIGYVPQNPPLIRELTAKDNLKLWYANAGTIKEEMEDTLLRDLEIGSFLNKPVSKLSGGMKKRLSIACAISHHPSILLLDEPGAALDLVCKEIIVRFLKDFCKTGGIVIMASHELQEITSCSTTYVMKDGVLTPYRFDGSVENLVRSL